MTGGGGFLATHLTRRLIEGGDDVSLLLRKGSGKAAPEGAQVVRGDLLVAGQRLVPADTEVVYHLAAQSNVPASLADPAATFKVNAMGTARLLEEVRSYGLPVRRFVLASTAQVYGPPFGRALDEDHGAQPSNPYAASKLAAEALAFAFDALYGLPVTALRLFNVYGPGQRGGFVVPSVLSQCLWSDTLRIGNAWPLRDFVFVEDAVELFRRAGSRPAARGQVINVGSGRAVSIRAMVDAACKVTGCGLRPIVEAPRKRKNDFSRLVADPRKAQRLLGWRPRVSLEEGLSRTAAWMRLQPRASQAG